MNPYKLIAPLLLVFLIACGSASAPPISLPAPLTGKVVITSPDDDGFIHVDGGEGAVDSGLLVMAINEDTAIASLLERTLEGLVPSAYASTLPGICSETGYACDEADTVGAFSILIPGEIGHVIIVVIIDPVTGEEISERLVVSVPSNVTSLKYPPLDVVGLSGYAYLLFASFIDQGIESSVLYYDATGTKNYVDLGAYGGLHIYSHDNMAGGSISALGVSFVDAVSLYYNDPTMQNPITFVVQSPTDMTFFEYISQQQEVDVAMVTMAASSLIKIYDFTDSTQSDFTFTAFGNVAGCDSIKNAVLDQLPVFIMTCRFANNAGSTDVGFGLAKPLFFAPNDKINGLEGLTAVKMIPSGYTLKSISEYVDATNTLQKIMVSLESTDGSGSGVVLAYDIVTIAAGSYVISDPVTVSDPAGLIKHPGYLLPVMDTGGNYAFLLVDDGTSLQPDGVVVIDIDSMSVVSRKSVGLTPVKAGWDYSGDLLAVVNRESKSVIQYTLGELLAP